MSYKQAQKPRIQTEIPGPRSRLLRSREDEHLAPGLQNFALLSGVAIASALDLLVTDVDGNQFIDLIGGIGVGGIGHSHPKYLSALQAQMSQIATGSFTSAARVELCARVAKFSPARDLHRLQLYSSGAEAVESALRLAKSFTGANEFISFSGGFHGKTLGVLGLMGSDFKKSLGPYPPGQHIVSYANCAKCPLKLNYPECGLACVEVAKQQVRRAASGKIAAIVVEPMQGTAGNIIPPPDFLPAIKTWAQELGALLIADEMITGFGRTGEPWGVSHTKTVPDIITLGKQFGGGFPISALLTTDEISQAKPWSLPSGSSSSFGGNPLACAAAAASLRIIEEEHLVENSRETGAYFLKGLEHLQERHSLIGAVRGRGLFLAIDFVQDQKTREPLAHSSCQKLFQKFLSRGLLTMAYTPSFRIQPAMTLNAATVDVVLEIMDEVLGEGV